MDFKFDENASFRYISIPNAVVNNGYIRKAQLEGRTQSTTFGVDVGPAVNLHYFKRLENPVRISENYGLKWTKRFLEIKDATLDIGGQFMTNFHHAGMSLIS